MSRLEDITPIDHLKPHQAAEFERARIVLIFKPELAVWMNCLHPAGALYERPIDPKNARE